MGFRLRKDATTRLLEAQEKRARELTKSEAELRISKEKAEIALIKAQRKGQIELERKLAPSRKRRIARGVAGFGAGLERIGAAESERQRKRKPGGGGGIGSPQATERAIAAFDFNPFEGEIKKKEKKGNIFKM